MANLIMAKKLADHVGFPAEMVEDSIIPILPYYRQQAQRVLQQETDDIILGKVDSMNPNEILDMHRSGRSPDSIVQAIHANNQSVIADDRSIVDPVAYETALAAVQGVIAEALKETAHLALKRIEDWEPRVAHNVQQIRDYIASLEPAVATSEPLPTAEAEPQTPALPVDEVAPSDTPTKKGR